jgi:hypothetical protein
VLLTFALVGLSPLGAGAAPGASPDWYLSLAVGMAFNNLACPAADVGFLTFYAFLDPAGAYSKRQLHGRWLLLLTFG